MFLFMKRMAQGPYIGQSRSYSKVLHNLYYSSLPRNEEGCVTDSDRAT
jgi:hypothetical protein